MNTTHDRLCVILVKDYKLEPDTLVPEATLETLGIDSLGLAELLFNIEDEFKITLTDNPVSLTTLHDVTSYIDDLVAAQHGVVGAGVTARMPTAPTP
jgi:acyl carrier protein